MNKKNQVVKTTLPPAEIVWDFTGKQEKIAELYRRTKDKFSFDKFTMEEFCTNLDLNEKEGMQALLLLVGSNNVLHEVVELEFGANKIIYNLVPSKEVLAGEVERLMNFHQVLADNYKLQLSTLQKKESID